MGRIITDFLTFLGLTNASGRWYSWWSGIVGDIGLFGGGYLILRKHNCHVHGCLRIGRHESVDAAGNKFIVCKPHHPDLGHDHKLRPHHLIGKSVDTDK